MTEQEVTYTEEVEKTEELLVCDGCGVEVEEGENCVTLLEWDSLKVYSHRDMVELCKNDVSKKANGMYTVRPDKVRDRFDKEVHFCLSCWSGVNLSLDEETATVVEDFESKMREQVKRDLRKEWKEKSIVSKLLSASLKTFVFFLLFLGLTVGVYMLPMGLFWFMPAMFAVVVFLSMLADPEA